MVAEDLQVEFPTRDLLLALQGYPGNLFQIKMEDNPSKKSTTFIVKDNALTNWLLHPSEVLLAKQFIDIASNHYYIQDFYSERHNFLGKYLNRLTDGIIKSIKPYTDCLDVIEKQIYNEIDSGKIPLTRFHEVFAFEDFFRRLKSLIVKYTDKQKTTNEVLSEIWTNTTSCSSSQSRFGFSIIFHEIKSALLEDCWQWMTLGSVSEINRDIFFIRKTGNNTFRLTDDVPNCISIRVAEKILFIGNLVHHFSRKDWKDYKGFSMQLNPVFTIQDIEEFFQEFIIIRDSKPFSQTAFFSFVESIRVKAAAFSSKYVLETEDIVGHYECIKDVLLTANEKIWILFLEEIKKIPLDQKWREEKKDRVIRSALESILLKLYCNQEVVDECLSDMTFSFIKKKNIKNQDGTEILPVLPFFFQVNYKLPSLSDKIMQQKFLDKYQSIFNFFLELLSTRCELSLCWKNSVSHYKKRRIARIHETLRGSNKSRTIAMKPETHSDKKEFNGDSVPTLEGKEVCSNQKIDCLKGISTQSLLRHKLLFFLEHLYFYLKVNVVEEQTLGFLHVLQTCKDYEQMQMQHSLFVGNLMRETFLDYPAVNIMFRRLFSMSHELCCLKEIDEDFDSRLKNLEKEIKTLFSDLKIVLDALKEYRFHSSLGQLLLQLSSH
jgi:hypothetical protein